MARNRARVFLFARVSDIMHLEITFPVPETSFQAGAHRSLFRRGANVNIPNQRNDAARTPVCTRGLVAVLGFRRGAQPVQRDCAPI